MPFTIPIPGVPALLHPPSVNSLISKLNLTTPLTQSTTPKTPPAPPQWGIYLNGSPAITVDSVVSVEYREDSRISDYPIEAGGFQTYNKVTVPFDARVRITRSGNDADRAVFLAALQGLRASFDLYDVVTPEKTYTSVSVQRYDYKRTGQEGAGMISAELWLVQVQTGATAAFTNTVAPTGAAAINVGALQPQPAPTSVVTGVGTAY